MNKNIFIAALTTSLVLPVAAQSLDKTPTAIEAQQARENARRDAKLADEMQKARVREEAKPVAAYIPAEQAQPAIKEHKPEVFTAGVPGAKKKKEKAPTRKKKKTAE